jgi:hypothetical protein
VPRRAQTPRSVIHRTAVWSGAGVFGVGGFAVLLEFGNRLVDAAGVPTNDAVDEASRLIEIVGAGQQIRVLPDGVAGVRTDGPGQTLPQRGSFPQLAWPLRTRRVGCCRQPAVDLCGDVRPYWVQGYPVAAVLEGNEVCSDGLG